MDESQHQLNEIRNKYKRDRIDNESGAFCLVRYPLPYCFRVINQDEPDEHKYKAMVEIIRGLIRENDNLNAELNEVVKTAASKNIICDVRMIELEIELQWLKSINTKLIRTIEDMKKEIKKKDSAEKQVRQ